MATQKVQVRVIKKYFDNEFKETLFPNHFMYLTVERAKALAELKLVEIIAIPKLDTTDLSELM